MTTSDPLSLTQAKRLTTAADTILLRATRPADLETPIGAFLRLDDGSTPAYLLESVEGGERLGRYSFLGVGPRRLLEVRDGRARVQTRPVTVPTYSPDLPTETTDAPDPLDAIRRFVTRRRVQPVDGMPRFTGGAVGALAYDAVSMFEHEFEKRREYTEEISEGVFVWNGDYDDLHGIQDVSLDPADLVV